MEYFSMEMTCTACSAGFDSVARAQVRFHFFGAAMRLAQIATLRGGANHEIPAKNAKNPIFRTLDYQYVAKNAYSIPNTVVKRFF